MARQALRKPLRKALRTAVRDERSQWWGRARERLGRQGAKKFPALGPPPAPWRPEGERSPAAPDLPLATTSRERSGAGRRNLGGQGGRRHKARGVQIRRSVRVS